MRCDFLRLQFFSKCSQMFDECLTNVDVECRRCVLLVVVVEVVVVVVVVVVEVVVVVVLVVVVLVVVLVERRKTIHSLNDSSCKGLVLANVTQCIVCIPIG